LEKNTLLIFPIPSRHFDANVLYVVLHAVVKIVIENRVGIQKNEELG
jgi:hypothetical protein